MTAYHPDALINLALAVIAQAISDAKSRERGKSARVLMAQSWLIETGSTWFDCLGLDGEIICRAIARMPAGKLRLVLSPPSPYKKRKATLSVMEENL